MLTRDWHRQRRHVQRLHKLARNKRAEQLRLSAMLKLRSMALFARMETMVMIGATGAVWTARLKDARSPRKPLRELVKAGLTVNRWKWTARRIRARLRRFSS